MTGVLRAPVSVLSSSGVEIAVEARVSPAEDFACAMVSSVGA
jgi:hypothetical protein